MDKKIKIIIIIILSFLFAFLLNEINLSLLGQLKTPLNQQDMIIDAYYYWQQGSSIFNNYGLNLNFDLYHYRSPTLNSVGVVFFASILSAVGLTPHTIPIFFFLIYMLFFLRKVFNPDLLPLLISFFTLAPLLFINSKEAYLYIASFCMLMSFYSTSLRSLVYLASSLLLFFFARFEILFVLFAGFAFIYIPEKLKPLIFLTLLVCIFTFFRERFFAGPIELEKYLISKNLHVFKGQYEYVLLTSDTNLVYVLINRFIVFLCLPIKWLIGIGGLANKDITFTDAVNIVEQFLFICLYFSYCLIYLKYRELIDLYRKFKEFRYLCSVVGIYVFYYGVFLFHQPSRQIMFALSIFLLMLSIIKNRARLPW